MKAKFSLIICWLIAWGGCTTAHVAPMNALPENVPDYVVVPHPEGLDYGDLLAIFTDRTAPSTESLKACDADFRKLYSSTSSREEIERGAREFVRLDPVRYHWCFYGKILEMEDHLKTDSYVDEKQKHLVDTYVFLTPIARAFLAEYQESRYLRWASTRYRRASEYVFYRRVELTDRAAAEMQSSVNPFGLLRSGSQAEVAERGVLEKYGILRPAENPPLAETPPTVNAAPQSAEREPASVPTAPSIESESKK